MVRNMALLLRPSMLDDLGLVPALQWQAREVSKRSGVWVKVDAATVSDDLPEEHKTCIYRVVQEALHNMRAARRRAHVKVAVGQDDGRLRLRFDDDGKGFDAAAGEGHGAARDAGARSHLGGSFAVESRAGRRNGAADRAARCRRW